MNILKYGGLTVKEYTARMRWEQMSEEDRQKLLSAGKLNHFVAVPKCGMGNARDNISPVHIGSI
ncbi:hypothetical protein [Methanomethylovorans sp. PtaU1.Bin093]|uniref:hypothetical protein n=1 Tax=Methanomethylovorans sp. PtaU1.Bin093 TaxID=1811679 RepID=UPI0025CBE260|nr:hypothetical protein [Methanomethylovorans sp. PtaU1.Bin093]